MGETRKAAALACGAAALVFCISLASSAQAADSGDFQTLLKQGFALHQQARFAEAIPLLERARALEPSDYFANLLLGIDLLRIGKPTQALPRLRVAAQGRPGEEIPEGYLGEAEASVGHYALAAEAYQQAVLRSHASEQSLEDWAGFALERFRQIGISLRATDAGVATIRRLKAASGNPKEPMSCKGSIPALERKLALRSSSRVGVPQDMNTAYVLSICYAVEAGNAAGQLQTAAEDPAALHRLRGDVLLRLKGDAAAAEREYKLAISMRPDDPALLERLAEAQLTAGDSDGARQTAQAALAIDPHQADALRTLASLAMQSRDYKQALPWLQRLSAESPGDRTVQVELGKALEQSGSAAESLRYLAPALAAGYPDEKGALHALEARALRQLGRDAEAARVEAEARRLSDAFQAHGAKRDEESLSDDQ
ncbi:MAG: tetratricopeptide repeat protein [Acidobacteriaceae bacterium]